MRKLTVGIACAWLLSCPLGVSAQGGTAWRDSVKRLSAAVQTLEDSLVRGDSAASDVGRNGDLVIAASPLQRERASAALAEFAAARRRWFGTALPSENGFRIVVQIDRGGRRWDGGSVLGNPAAAYPANAAGSIILAGLPDKYGAPRSYLTVRASDVNDGLLDRYAEMMVASVPALGDWFLPPSLAQMDRDHREQAMYTFVTGSGAMERACVRGDNRACERALALAPVTAADSGSQFNTTVRADLFYYTLEHGGDSAWVRFNRAARNDLPSALTAAAGIPLDTLIDRWRGSLLALRPEHTVLDASLICSALAWTLAITMLTVGVSKWG